MVYHYQYNQAENRYKRADINLTKLKIDIKELILISKEKRSKLGLGLKV